MRWRRGQVSDALKRIEEKHIHWATDGTPDVVKLARALVDVLETLETYHMRDLDAERVLEEVAE
jgi:hypothetical protein